MKNYKIYEKILMFLTNVTNLRQTSHQIVQVKCQFNSSEKM